MKQGHLQSWLRTMSVLSIPAHHDVTLCVHRSASLVLVASALPPAAVRTSTPRLVVELATVVASPSRSPAVIMICSHNMQ